MALIRSFELIETFRQVTWYSAGAPFLVLVCSSSVCTSPSAVVTVVGFLDARTVSNSAKFRSFLLGRCTDAPESTTNYLSSSFFADGASDDQTSEGDWNVALSLVLSLWTLFANAHASLRAHLSCCKVSSCVLSSNLAAQRLRS